MCRFINLWIEWNVGLEFKKVYAEFFCISRLGEIILAQANKMERQGALESILA